MRIFRTSLLLLAMSILVFGVLPTSAQTDFNDEEQALIEEVSKAFDSLLALSSMRNETAQVIDQEISFLGEVIIQTITQESDVYVLIEDGVTVASQGVVTQTIDSEDTGLSGVSVIEVIIVDETLYMRSTEATGILVGQFPVGWVNVTEDPMGFPGGEAIDLEALSSLEFPINTETVSTVELIDVPEELEGVTRAISLTLNNEALIEVGFVAELAAGFSEAGLGADIEAMVDAMLENAKWEMVVYLDSTGLIQQLDMVILITADLGPAMGMGSLLFDQVAASTIIYSAFNEPVEITAPID